MLWNMDKQDAGAVHFYRCMLYADGDIKIVPGNVSYLLDNLLGLLTGWCEKRSIIVYAESLVSGEKFSDNVLIIKHQ